MKEKANKNIKSESTNKKYDKYTKFIAEMIKKYQSKLIKG